MAIRHLATVSLATVALTGILASGCSPNSSLGGTQVTSRKPVAPPVMTAIPGTCARAVADFTNLVDRFGKAVVNVEVARQSRTVANPLDNVVEAGRI